MTKNETASFSGSKPHHLQRLLVVFLVSVLVSAAGVKSMPVLDRDEARFAQATAQMLETGDYINIRFQDEERNKKPAGIHWMQAASVSALSSVEAREIWAYRIPSMAGVVIAALFTYLAGARLYNPVVGMFGALLLACAPGVAGEATIAKTDAMLLASVCAAQAAFIHIYAKARARENAGWVWPIILWVSIALGVLIKGPIAPMIVGLTGIGILLRRRRFDWIAALKPVTGAVILVLMVTPWALAIGQATDGRFFTEAIGGDMIGKVNSVQESHSGPPGYHFTLLWILFWPASALLIPAAIQVYKTKSIWTSYFLLAWILPSWAVFELTSTKLPHYTMPLYPALAILAARAVTVGIANRRRWIGRIGAGVYTTIGLAIAIAIAIVPTMYGQSSLSILCFSAAGFVAIASWVNGALFWQGRNTIGGASAAGLSVALAWILLGSVLPQLDRLALSPRIAAAIDEAGLHPISHGANASALAGYYEPSAVFLLGTKTKFTDGSGAAQYLASTPRAAVVIEARHAEEFQNKRKALGLDILELGVIDGLNYSNGDEVVLRIYKKR